MPPKSFRSPTLAYKPRRSRTARKYSTYKAPRTKYNIKQRTREAKGISRLLRNVIETKKTAHDPFNEVSPTAIAVGSVAYFHGGVVGGPLTAWGPGWDNLGGIPTGGSSGAQFEGNSYFMKNITIMGRITTNVVSGPLPMNFRLIVAKNRRIASAIGFTANPSTQLFQNFDGQQVGHDVAGITGTDLMLLNTNKAHFDILKDVKFSLQPPGQQDPAGTDPRPQIQGVYKCSREFKVSCPINRKIYRDPSFATSQYGNNNNLFYVIYADTVTRDGFATNWEVSTRGCTSFNDM